MGKSALIEKLLKSNFLIPVMLVCAALLILPSLIGGGAREKEAEATPTSNPLFTVDEQEKRLAVTLSEIYGVGEVTVLLSVSGGVERTLASDEGETVIVSTGSGSEEAVELRYSYPEYKGAVVVCSGASNASVRLAVMQAVMSFTGLGSDRITILPGHQ